MKGTAIFGGYAVGNALLILPRKNAKADRKPLSKEEEQARLKAAIGEFIKKTQAQAEYVKKSVGEKEADILLGHIAMINDPYMTDEMLSGISGGLSAEEALKNVCDMFISVFSSAEDEFTRERAADIRDVKAGVLEELTQNGENPVSSAKKGSVLVIDEFTPSVAAQINPENVCAVIAQTGSVTSHGAILARAMKIPSVFGVKDALTNIKDGEELAVDAVSGEITPLPTQEQKEEFFVKREEHLKSVLLLEKYALQPAVTKDGVKKDVFINIGSPEEAKDAAKNGAEGIGLFRTEFLFMEKASAPTEEEQFSAYKEAAQAVLGKPVIIRTLDIGGDKQIDYLGIKKEENPFLGFRAIRYCLKNKELFKTQLRALLRASAYGDIRIMLPLVADVSEITAARQLLEEAKAELEGEGKAFNKDIMLGVMIETPAAAVNADILCKYADFFSIGTNDLTQYTLAVDRGNDDVTYLYSVFHPAVLRLIEHIVKCANKAGIPVGMCGEAAADPAFAPLLISFGLDEFSVSPQSVAQLKKSICETDKKEADELKKSVMTKTSAEEILGTLKSHII